MSERILGCPKCGCRNLTLSRLNRVEFSVDSIEEDGEVLTLDAHGTPVDTEEEIVRCDECDYEGDPRGFILSEFTVTVTVQLNSSSEEAEAWRGYLRGLKGGRTFRVSSLIPDEGSITGISVNRNPLLDNRHR